MKKLLSAPLVSTSLDNVLIIFLLFLFLFLSPAFGQATRDSDHKSDRNLKSQVRVNPATFAMEFSIPLANYPGRAGNSLPVSFNYSSKLWTMRQSDFRGRLLGGDGYQAHPWLYTFITSVTPFFGERTMSGWTSSLGPISIVPEIESFNADGSAIESPQAETTCTLMEEYWVNDDPACPFGRHVRIHRCDPEIEGTDPQIVTHSTCYIGPNTPSGPGPSPTPFPVPDWKVKRIRLQMPDGSTREFRKDDKAYDCNLENCIADEGTYLSVDGTGLRLVVGTSSNATGMGSLHLSDGGRYYFPIDIHSDVSQQFIDKDGNRAEYNPTTRTWTDTVGRSIVDPVPGPESLQTGETEFHLPSLGSQNNEYLQKWETLKPDTCATGSEPSCLNSALENPAEALYSQGNDTCQDRDVDNPTSTPRLFAADPTYTEQVITQSNPQRWYLNTYKFRICGGIFNPIVLHSLTLPDGSKYWFKYNVYGEITKIIYPTGAYERFQYGTVVPLTALTGPYDQANRGVTKRWISEDGITEQQEWNYANSSYGTPGTSIITAPDGSRTVTTYNTSASPFGFENPMTGKVIEEKVYSAPVIQNDPNSRKLLKRTINDYAVAPPRLGGWSNVTRDARLSRSVSIAFELDSDDALATLSKTVYDDEGSSDPEYFSHLNAKETKSYHFAKRTKSDVDDEPLAWNVIEGWFPESKLAAVSQTDYSYDPDYKARGIIGLPTETRAMDPAFPNDPTKALSRTQIFYDNQLPSAPGTYPGSYSVENYSIWNDLNCGDAQNPKTCWQNPQSSRIGRLTTSRIWDDDTDTWIQTHTRYDIFGNAIAARDPVGNEPTTEFSPTYKYAYPTKLIAPAPDPTNNGTGTNETSTVETAYDFSTGLPTSVTDAFGQVTTTTYDNMLRPRFVNPVVVNGNPTGPVSETIYGIPDANGQFQADQRFVKVKKQIDATNWDEATTWFDGLGRTVKTQAKDSQGDVFVETQYDNLGRPFLVSNPYRVGDTIYWSKTKYDAAGRAVQSFAPATAADITTSATNNNANLTSLGVTSFDISTLNNASGNFIGTVVTTEDASGRKGRSITNALGHLLRVDEPDKNTGQLGDIDTPIQPTSYEYDAYGKMVEVTQGDQKRWFKYDSLGRLLRVRQPEQEINQSLDMADAFNTSADWTAGFVYDILGNVVRATDANGVNIINEYDKANRVTKRCYTKPNISTTATTCEGIGAPNLSTDTPTVEFFYDGKGLASPQTPNYAKGKLTKITSSISETQYSLFDNFGRLTESKQITDGQTYTSKYTYNLSGALVEEEYPSGRKVKNEFESDGDLSRVFGSPSAAVADRTYANSFSYTASGGISHMRLGNGKWETAKFNERLQVTELGLGSSATNAALWKVNYTYGDFDNSWNFHANKNTGNIAKQTLTIPGATFVQNYRYDSLYRLKDAVEPGAGSTPNWTQTFLYDRYGNRTGFTQTVGGVITHNSTPAVSNGVNGTNRFTSTNFEYDKNGNLVGDVDPYTSQSRDFSFNADNKQREVIVNGASVGSYFYDGEGKRVKKVTNAETTIFVYSSGKLVAEYSTQISQNPTISYTTTDHLGSPRIITDQLGQVKSRRDFMPFGEDLFNGIGARSSSQSYSSTGDDIKQKFTGYLKDNETGLDFAEARMYENRHGRFTAVDPLLASGKSADPQSFNRYAYVLNNPLHFIDPDGAKPIWWRRRENNTWRYRLSDGSPGAGFREYSGPRRIIAEQHKWGRRWNLTSRGAIPIDDTSGNYVPRRIPTQVSAPASNGDPNGLLKDLGRRGPALENITTGLSVLMVFPAALPLAPYAVSGGGAAAAAHESLAVPVKAVVDFGLGLGTGLVGERLLNDQSDRQPDNSIPNVYVSNSRWPEAAQHIVDAQGAGYPSVLTIDRPGRARRSDAALRGYPSMAPYFERDEYPPAVFLEGGEGASVCYINPWDNGGAGASIGNQLRPYPDGQQVRIVVVP